MSQNGKFVNIRRTRTSSCDVNAKDVSLSATSGASSSSTEIPPSPLSLAQPPAQLCPPSLSTILFLRDIILAPKLLVLVLLTLQVAVSVVLGRIVMSRGNATASSSSTSSPPPPADKMQTTVLVMWTEWVKIIGCGLWLWITDPSPQVAEQIQSGRGHSHDINSIIKGMAEEGGVVDNVDYDEDVDVVRATPLYVITHPITTFIPQLLHIWHHVFCRGGMKTVFLPAVLFTIQANVIYIALRNLDVMAFQVLHQLKLPLTAVASSIIVGVKVSRIQWLSLFVLFLGIVIAQLKPPSGRTTGGGNPTIGLAAVLLCVACSTASAVLMELLLKRDHKAISINNSVSNVNSNNTSTNSNYGKTTTMTSINNTPPPSLPIATSPVSVSVRNIQLAVYLFSFTFAMHFVSAWRWGEGSGASRIEAGFVEMTRGLDLAVWFLILVQAAGGVIVSLVLVYANNILKGISIGCSMVVVGALNWLVLGVVPSLLFTFGAFTVMTGVIAFSVVSAWKL